METIHPGLLWDIRKGKTKEGRIKIIKASFLYKYKLQYLATAELIQPEFSPPLMDSPN